MLPMFEQMPELTRQMGKERAARLRWAIHGGWLSAERAPLRATAVGPCTSKR